MGDEKRYGPSCRHCGNHLCDCRASADDAIRGLQSQLAERTRERDAYRVGWDSCKELAHMREIELVARAEKAERELDEARAAAERHLHGAEYWNRRYSEEYERANLKQFERGAARAEVGRLVEQLAEVTGRLTLAEIEVGRLREALGAAAECMQNMTNWVPERSVGAFELRDALNAACQALERAGDEATPVSSAPSGPAQ